MHALASAVVLSSTATHAYWNFLLKRAGGRSAFVGLSKVAEVVCFAPVFLWIIVASPWPGGAIVLIAVGALLVLANYAALARAYASGELSLVYPVSRAGTLLFLPALGFLVFGERLTMLGWLAIALIGVGIVVLQLPAFTLEAVLALVPRLRSKPVIFALAAALAAALYTVWDKRAVQHIPAFIYFYSYTAMVAVVYMSFVLRQEPASSVRDLWRSSWPSIVQVGVFNSITYLLVLFALREETSSYVIALRQLSIVWGALLGRALLGESLTRPKQAGIAMLVAGCVLVALAR